MPEVDAEVGSEVDAETGAATGAETRASNGAETRASTDDGARASSGKRPGSSILSDRQKLAWAALVEITPAETIGAPAGETAEADGIVSYLFENTMAGYPGWLWTVTVAQVDDAEPSVLEAELMPADGALLAPDWVPWSERMDDYRAAQLALGELADAEALEDLDSELDDDAELDDEDLDDEDDDLGDDLGDDLADDLGDDDEDSDAFTPSTLHSGDLDGVDIDELDDSQPLDGEPESAEPESAQPVTSQRNSRQRGGRDSGVSAVGVDEADEAESEAGGASVEPPAVPARRKWGRKRK
jgi:hypothetical protein